MKTLKKEQLYQLLLIKLIGDKIDEKSLIKKDIVNQKDLNLFKDNGFVKTYKDNAKNWVYIDPLKGTEIISPVMEILEALVNINLKTD